MLKSLEARRCGSCRADETHPRAVVGYAVSQRPNSRSDVYGHQAWNREHRQLDGGRAHGFDSAAPERVRTRISFRGARKGVLTAAPSTSPHAPSVVPGPGTASSSREAGETGEAGSPLGIVPHQIRGFLGNFDALKITGQAYDRCTGCSEAVRELFGALLTLGRMPVSTTDIPRLDRSSAPTGVILSRSSKARATTQSILKGSRDSTNSKRRRRRCWQKGFRIGKRTAREKTISRPAGPAAHSVILFTFRGYILVLC